jgi:hypothetical protein
VTACVIGAVAAVAAILAPGASARPAQQAKPAAGAHPCLVMTGSGDAAFTRSFNPYSGSVLNGGFMKGAMYEPLIIATVAGGGKIYPWLAQSWKWSNGNKTLTLLSNMFTNLNLTDMETGSKMFRREAIDGIVLEENRFGIEPELTAKLARKGCVFYEIGIAYFGRTYAEGKKIGWRDGVRAIIAIVKYNVFR